MMIFHFLKKNFKFIIEIILILSLVIFSIIQSEKFLRGWHGPGGSITTDLYIPSIMFACGHGFTNVNPNDVPHLRAFLDFNQQVFLEEYVPKDVPYLDWDIYQNYHRYLIYTVGILWRLFGVSWEVLRWFLVFLYATTVLIVYAIARVFLPSYLAVVMGYYFARAEEVLIILPILRDFARAPFILLVIFLLFRLLRGVVTNKQFVFYCVLLGLACGVGIGFRRDLMIFFVLALLVLLILPKNINVPKLSIRLVGVITVIFVFFVSSYPILQAFYSYGTLGWHDTLMGFGIEHDDLAGLQRTNYERMPKHNDLFVSATADVHCYYHEQIHDYELHFRKNTELQKRKLFFSYIYWFPADIVIRTYSSITRVLDSVVYNPFPINLYHALLSLGVILLFMAVDFRRGVCFAIVLFYAIAIQTLQFHFRHNFYLAFIPYLLYFLLLYWFLMGMYHLWRGGKANVAENMQKLISIAKKFMIIVFTGAFFSLGILIVARQIQSYQVSRLFQAYHTADQIPIPYTTYSTEEGTVYALDKPLSARFEDPFVVDCSFTPNILIIDFAVKQFPACFETLYDGTDNFSSNLTIKGSANSGKEPTYVRYFLSVYENMQDLKSNWNRFVGIRIEDASKLEVAGLYKVCNIEKVPLFINYYFVKNELPDVYQQIAPYMKSPINPCWKPYGVSSSQMVINNANEAFLNGDKGKAYDILQKAMEREPFLLKYGFTLADFYEAVGELDTAKEVYIQLISNRPHDPIPGIKLSSLLSRLRFSETDKQKFWEDVTHRIPESSVAWLYYAKSQQDKNTAKEALAKAVLLNKAILLSTPLTSVHYEIRDIFSQVMGDEKNADSSLCSTIPLREQVSYMLTAGMYLSEHNEYQKAVDILQFLVKITPQFHLIYPPLISALLKKQDTNLDTLFYYNTTLISLIPYRLEPITQIEEIHENIRYLSEQEWIEIWKDLESKFPNSPCILCGLGRAYELSEQNTEAQHVYEKAIRYVRKSDECAQLVYYRWVKLLYQSGQKNNAITLLKKAIRQYPNNPILKSLLEQYE